MDAIVEIFLEISMELYLGLAELIVPERKFKKWQTTLLKLLCILVSISILVLFIGGLILLFDEDKTNPTAGIIMTSVGGGLLFVHVIMEVVIIVKGVQKERKAKRENENKENASDTSDSAEDMQNFE